LDLNLVNIEDISCTSEAIRHLVSLGVEEMPNVAGITEFDYRPPALGPETVGDYREAREASETAEASPVLQDPPDDPEGAK
jgi:hypothetical protein